jgi:uncharacterized protein (TIGR01777 family)
MMESARTVLITGGTGMVGSALVPVLLQKGYKVILLTRSLQSSSLSRNAHPALQYATWDPDSGLIDTAVLEQADHIVHLAGANVAEKRWTASRKKEICDSRVKSGRLLTSALQKLSKRPVSFISASAIGWYGADASYPATPFREEAPYDRSFLGETCKQWEDSIQELPAMDIRTVILRIGIVLSRKGGALPEFIKPLRLGVAPILGSGKQVISWIQLEDLVAMIVFAIEQPRLRGVYNAVAPAPATQQQLMNTLAQLTKRFFIPVPVPSWILQVVMGEMSIEVLKSTTVSADKILATGFSFRYPMLREALAAS